MCVCVFLFSSIFQANQMVVRVTIATNLYLFMQIQKQFHWRQMLQKRLNFEMMLLNYIHLMSVLKCSLWIQRQFSNKTKLFPNDHCLPRARYKCYLIIKVIFWMSWKWQTISIRTNRKFIQIHGDFPFLFQHLFFSKEQNWILWMKAFSQIENDPNLEIILFRFFFRNREMSDS